MTAAFQNVRTGTLVHIIRSKNRVAFQMMDNLNRDIIAGTGKRVFARLDAWREAVDYCIALDGRTIRNLQVLRAVEDAEQATE